MSSFFNLPRTRFCEISELLTLPRILIGNRQLPPGARSMKAVEFSPKSASATDIEQSEAAHANGTHIKDRTPTMSAKAAIFENCIVVLVFIASAVATSFGWLPKL